jgi:uncharacterized protein (TIGR01777 family)
MKKVVGIIGATGLIGSEVARAFTKLGMRVVRISRAQRNYEGQEWRVLGEKCLAGIDILINLAGEPIDQRWSESNKEKFYASRVELTQYIYNWIKVMPVQQRPSLWLNASAVGIYGDRAEEQLDESASVGAGYLSNLCSAWELAAHKEPMEGCRVVHPRIGVVLGHESHAWQKMKKVFQYGVGGKLGTGKQWFPWVHLHDVVRALLFLSLDSRSEGPYNIVAPGQVTNVDFTKALGRKLRRPTFCSVPACALRIVLGEFSEALLASQRTAPQGLDDLGFEWHFKSLEMALSELCTG